MPELPEVETVARTLRPLIVGRTITSAQVLLSRSVHELSLPLDRLVGRGVADVSRRGKLVLLNLAPVEETDARHASCPCPAEGTPGTAHAVLPAQSLTEPSASPAVLAVHLRMTGRLFVFPPSEPVGRHTRVILGLSDGNRLFFDDARTFGLMLLATPYVLTCWPFWTTLGPEPLTLSAEDFAARVRARRGSIKAVLLDQKVIAGIGNIYADESCFRAGIDPRRQASSLSPAACARLLACVREVLLQSIRECGSSIKDYRTARGDAGAFQNYFRVYGRAGQRCLACGGELEGARVAGRATVFCRHCQQ
ncbi:MAG: bifunctional DNA-formamidopyrimidine glycosylase/DNA-(apurinic or apyrimidinic site) lyase [Desulfovibrionaceae bacterium]|nr:bifunctional DNA-formamidopyrimidine glycosylase/DNA-(apurinic or apyrimidinic site) lyase [Desulfovibrionaceae bacterium]